MITLAEFVSLQNASKYILSTEPISSIANPLLSAFQHLAFATIDFTNALVEVLFLIAVIILKLLILAFPHALNLMKIIYDFHKTQLTPRDMVVEFVTIAVILICVIFRKQIQRTWKKLETNISAKSKAVAQAAPHVAFFAAALTFAYFGKKFLLPFTSPSVMPVFTLIIPIINTILLWRKLNTLNDKHKVEELSHKFGYWVILAIYHSSITCMAMIPFSSRMMNYLPFLRELIIVISIWIQISRVFTDTVLVVIIAPVMRYISAYIPTAHIHDSHTSKSQQQQQQQQVSSQLTNNAIYLLCKNLNILNNSQIEFLLSLLKDSVVTLMAFILIFLPYPFSSIGMVMIAWLLPAFRTVSLVNSFRVKTPSGGYTYLEHLTAEETDLSHHHHRKHGGNEKKKNGYYGSIIHWFSYWLCMSLLWCVKIYVGNFWDSILIILTLWLQHSFFQGAPWIISFSNYTLSFLIERNRSTQQLKELVKQQQQQEQQQLLQEGESDSLGCLRVGGDSTSSLEEDMKSTNYEKDHEEGRAEGGNYYDSGKIGLSLSEKMLEDTDMPTTIRSEQGDNHEDKYAPATPDLLADDGKDQESPQTIRKRAGGKND